MALATINPEEATTLTFDYKVSGTTETPSDFRFIIEGTDNFSIICKAVREADSIKVFIPRLLNLFKAGSYRSRIEVVLENRLFVPLQEDIIIESPNVDVSINIESKAIETENKISDIGISILSSLLDEETTTSSSVSDKSEKKEKTTTNNIATGEPPKNKKFTNPFRRKPPE